MSVSGRRRSPRPPGHEYRRNGQHRPAARQVDYALYASIVVEHRQQRYSKLTATAQLGDIAFARMQVSEIAVHDAAHLVEQSRALKQASANVTVGECAGHAAIGVDGEECHYFARQLVESVESVKYRYAVAYYVGIVVAHFVLFIIDSAISQSVGVSRSMLRSRGMTNGNRFGIMPSG